jgi:hypothetical protein
MTLRRALVSKLCAGFFVALIVLPLRRSGYGTGTDR